MIAFSEQINNIPGTRDVNLNDVWRDKSPDSFNLRFLSVFLNASAIRRPRYSGSTPVYS